jgi:hypothetical protein
VVNDDEVSIGTRITMYTLFAKLRNPQKRNCNSSASGCDGTYRNRAAALRKQPESMLGSNRQRTRQILLCFIYTATGRLNLQTSQTNNRQRLHVSRDLGLEGLIDCLNRGLAQRRD